MKKFKVLASTVAIGTAITPIFTAVGCSKDEPYTAFDKLIKEESIKEFIELAKVPRRFFQTRKIADYLCNRVEELGLIDSWNEDNYRAGTTPEEQDLSSGNCWFDIPATKGHEDEQGVILQGHMDMVFAPTPEAPTGVEAVVDGNTMHSKDYKTSLGADNGIGLGLLLALAKHRNEFVHGPIRCLITADEEKGKSGASELQNDTNLFTNKDGVKIYNNIVNVDSERQNQVTMSCADCYEYNYMISYAGPKAAIPDVTPVSTLSAKVYELKIHGLLGGHSANEINESRINGIGVMSEIIWSMNHYSTPTENGFNLANITSENNNNAIPKKVTAIFTSDKSLEHLKTFYIDPVFNAEKLIHPNEKDATYELNEITTLKPKYVFNDDTTDRLAEMLISIPFGPYEWIDEQLLEVATSNNVGPLLIDANKDESGEEVTPDTEVINSKFTALIRSCKKDATSGDSHSRLIGEYIASTLQRYFPKATSLSLDPVPSWTYEGETKIHTMFCQYYKDLGLELKTRNAHSWLECGYIKEANKDANIVSIGPEIVSPHDTQETLYLDTLNQVIHTILELLKNQNELK